MKAHLLSTTFLLLLTTCVLSQNTSLDWAVSAGGPQWDVTTDLTVDQAGNVYTTGFFSGTVDFDPGAGVSNLVSGGTGGSFAFDNTDGYIQKLDTNGNLVWAINHLSGDLSMNGSGIDFNKIAVDHNGNVFTLSPTVVNNSIDLDPSANTYYLGQTGSFKVLHKFDSNGNFLWVLPIVAGNHMKVDANGDIFISGVYPTGTIDIDPGSGVYNITNTIPNSDSPFMCKLSGATGDLIWGANFASACTGSRINSMKFDMNGNIAIGGYYKNMITADPNGTLFTLSDDNQNDQNGFVIKLDNTSGTAISSINYARTGNYNTETHDLGFDDANNLYALSTGLNSAVYGSGNSIIKYNASVTTTMWFAPVPQFSFHSPQMVVKPNAELYLLGAFSNTIDVDPDPNNSYNLIAASGNSTYIAKWDASPGYQGSPSLIWGLNLNHDFFIWNDVRIMGVVGMGEELFLAGAFTGTLDTDYESGVYDLIETPCNSGACADIFTQKINTCPGSTYTENDVELCWGESYTLPDGTTLTNIQSDTTHTYVQTLANGCEDVTVTNIIVLSFTTTYTTSYACPGSSVGMPDGTYYYNLTQDITHTSYLTAANGCDSIIVSTVVLDVPMTVTTSYDCQTNTGTVTFGDLGTVYGQPTPPFDFVVNGVTTTVSAPGTHTFSQLSSDESHRVLIYSNNCSPDTQIYPDCVDAPCSPNEIDLIGNGGFETQPDTDWNVTSTELDGTPAFYTIMHNHPNSFNSSYAAWMGGTSNGIITTIEQTVNLPIGYGATTLSWWEWGFGACSADDVLTVSIDGNTIYSATNNGSQCGDFKWHKKSLDISGFGYADDQDHTITFQFVQPATNGFTTLILDNISLLACPCPGSTTQESFYTCQGNDYLFPDGTIQTINSNTTYTSVLTDSYGCDSTVVTNVIMEVPPTMTATFNCDVNAIILNVSDMGTYLGNPVTSFDVSVGSQTTNIFSPGSYNISYMLGDISDQSWQVNIYQPNYCTPYLFIYPDCIDPACGDNAQQYVVNSDFEDTAANPNAWSESVLFMDGSDTGYSIIDDQYPYNSSFGAWLGGVSQGSTSNLEQSLTIPQGSGVKELTWWEYHNGACASDDIFTVSIDGNVIYSNTGANDPYCGDNTWHQRTIDVSAFADGNTHVLTFNYVQPSTNGHTNLFLDNIRIHVCPCVDYNTEETYYTCQGNDYLFPDGTTQTINSDVTYTSTLTASDGCDSIVVTNVIVEVPPTMTAHYSCNLDNIILTVTDMGTYQGNTSPPFDVTVLGGANPQTTTITQAGAYNISYAMTEDLASKSWRIAIFEPNNCSPDYWVYPDCYEAPCGTDAVEVISNGTFENTNPTDWVVSETFLDGVTNTGKGVLSGYLTVDNSAGAAWLGGWSQGSLSSIEQLVSFPQSQSITELVWWQREYGGCQSDDVFTISIDGTVVYTQTADNNPNCAAPEWYFKTLDVSAYADGNTHLLEFSYSQQGTNGPSSFFLDNVSIEVCDCSDSNTESYIVCSGNDFTFPDGTLMTNITSDVTYTSQLTNSLGCDSTIVTELVVNEPVIFNGSYDCTTNLITLNVTDMGLSGNPATVSGFNMMVGTTTHYIPAVGTYTFQGHPNQSWRLDVFDQCTPTQVVFTDDCLELECGDMAMESLSNGDFEDAVNTAWTTSSTYYDGSPRTFDMINTNYVYQYPNEYQSAHFGADFGEYLGTVSSISQNFTIPAGESTRLSWWQYERWACSPDNNLSIYVDSDLVYSLNSDQNASCNSLNWSYHEVDLSAYTGDGLIHNLSIVYTQPNTNGTSRLHMDNISIETCPCDTTVTQVSASICSGDDYTFPDGTTQTGITADVTQTSVIPVEGGCDSTVVTQLTLYPSTFNPPIFTYLCEGDDYTYVDGTVSTNLTTDESHVSVIPNQYGCDSSILELVYVQSYYNVEGDTWICEPYPYQKHIYVDDTATGNNDGTSWNDAFTDLQDALALAATDSYYKIHVAEGIYYPTTTTQRGKAFEIPERVDILGGYPNNGGTRNPDAHESILSGNIDQTPDKNGNSYHVVFIKDVQFVTIDGFTIRDGNANDANTFGRARGGGVYLKGSSSIVFENCDFRWNRGLFGGAMFATLSPVIQVNNCEFRKNRADYGSAIFHSNETRMYLDGTQIIDNTSDVRAAIEVNNSLYTRLINTVIADNITSNSNAISFVATNRDQSCDIYNSTITGEEKNKYLISMLIGFGDQLDINIRNSIIAHQNATFNKGFVAYQNGILNLHTDHCYLQGTSVLGTSNGNLYTGTDGALTLNSNFSLPSNSLGIDAGDDNLIQYYSTDITGAARVAGNAVDMGAYEYYAAAREQEKDVVATDDWNVDIYPNPTQGKVNIVFDEPLTSSAIVSVLNASGQLVFEEELISAQSQYSLDLEHMSSGIYFMRIQYGTQVETKQVVISK